MIGRKSLMEVSPEVTGGLKAALEQRERFDLSSQVARMTVPSQHVRGNAEDFTFSVIVVGRTADEEAEMLKGPKENEDLVLSLGTGEIEAFVNFFGRIDTLRIRNMPTLFDALKALPGYIGTDA